jgi:hypothetical protein
MAAHTSTLCCAACLPPVWLQAARAEAEHGEFVRRLKESMVAGKA